MNIKKTIGIMLMLLFAMQFSFAITNINDNEIYTSGQINLSGSVFVNVTNKNANIAGNVFALYMQGGTGNYLPHFWVQSGGANQASGVSRSFMIVNENPSQQANGNLTDCISYMTYAGETLKIDCNTTTTGADLLVGDDAQIIGDVWLKDTAGEWHYMTRELDIADAQRDETLISRINTSLSGENFSITQYDNKTLLVNLEETHYDLGKTKDSILLTSGTNILPQFNQIYYNNAPTPTITKSTTQLTNKADVGYFLIGASGKDYGSLSGSAKVYELNRGIYERFYDAGALYVSGFNIGASTTELNISSGIMKLIMDRETTTGIHRTNNFTRILSNGTFVDITNFNSLTRYRTSEAISNAKYFNVVFGIVHTENDVGRMYAVVQGKPSTEYNSIINAENDIQNMVEYFPQNDFLKHIFIPVARVVVQRSGGVNTIQTLSNGQLYFDVRGQVTTVAGSAPSPSISDHGQLAGLTDDDHIQYCELDGTDAFTGQINGTSALFSGLVTSTDYHLDGSTNAFYKLDRNAVGNAGRFKFQTNGTDNVEMGIMGGYSDLFVITDGDVNTRFTLNVSDGTTKIFGSINANDWSNASDLDTSGNVIDDSHNHIYSNIDAFTEANLYTLLSDVTQFYESGDKVGDADTLDTHDTSYFQIDLTDEASLYTALSDVSEFIETSDNAVLNSVTVAGLINHTLASGKVDEYSNGCYRLANTTGVYDIC